MIVANDRSAHDDPQLFDFMEAHTELVFTFSALMGFCCTILNTFVLKHF